VPHTEVELIVVNGSSVDFNYHMRDGDQVDVYPPSFNSEEFPSKVQLRGEPKIKFILDVHLGKLARILRMLGFDTIYGN
ncbi:twitching motility protein PilT, partial [Enterococcus hirae]